MRPRKAVALLLLFCVTGHAVAQVSEPRVNLLDVTCNDFLQALEIAKPVKGESKARKQKSAEAQDDIVYGLMWIHGYQAGKTGSGAVPALNEKWMADTVVRLANVCSQPGNGELPLIDVTAKL